MKRIFTISVILFTTLALISCGASIQQVSDDMPNMGVKAENWNTSIKLVDDPALLNSYKNGDTLFLRVENLSNTSIVFPDDFGIKIVTKEGQSWTSIPNNFYYTGQEILPTKASYPLGLIVNALPYVSNLTMSLNIRIIIIGYPEDNHKELLGAYLDTTLNP